MTTIPHPCLEVQASEQPEPSIPAWFAETIILAEYLRTHGLLEALTNQVHLVRGRFGQYEVLDFLALLFGYAISGEHTLQAYFDRLKPFAGPFMALFERNRLPHRTTLGRFLAAVDPSCLEAVRTLFVSSSYTWGWTQETVGGVWDRAGRRYLVFDIDGTREAARQRTLPSDPTLPPPRRRLERVCGPGYLGRQRGEVVRTRTTVLQMHTRQWLGTFGGRGNGDYRGDLTTALKAIKAYLTDWQLVPNQAIVRVDGQYGDGIVIADILATGVQIVGRCRTYSLLEHPSVRLVLTRAPVATVTAPESQISYEVFEAAICLDPGDLPVRVILTRRPWLGERVPVGKHEGEWVYEVFITSLPADGFRATDVLDLYHGRGAFEGTLAGVVYGGRSRPLVLVCRSGTRTMADRLAVGLESAAGAGAVLGARLLALDRMGAGRVCCQHRGVGPHSRRPKPRMAHWSGRRTRDPRRANSRQTRSPCGKTVGFNARLANYYGIRRHGRRLPHCSGSSTLRRTRTVQHVPYSRRA